MANSRRIARVASLIKREVSQMLMSDIKDDRVGAGMVSITDVDVSGDLPACQDFRQYFWDGRGAGQKRWPGSTRQPITSEAN